MTHSFLLEQRLWDSPPEALKAAGNIFRSIYPHIVEDIQKTTAPVIHLRSVVQKTYPVQTPYDGKVQEKGIESLLYRLYGAMDVLNLWPILYPDETLDILRSVAPRHHSEGEHSSQSPHYDLDWHMDAAYRPLHKKDILSPSPDYLCFGVVNEGYESLPLTYVNLDDILTRLGQDMIEIGLSPVFAVSPPDSFSETAEISSVPLLERDENGVFTSRINLQKTRPLTEEGASFLQQVKDIADKEKKTIAVKAGDVILLNNKRTLHKREKFIPRWDGRDRYFVRIYGIKDPQQGVLQEEQKPWVWA